jgi:hypothetical protein
MKIDYSPKLQLVPTPWGAIAQGVIGGAQAIGGWIQASRAEKQYNKLINSYKPNQSIMDYYSKALQKYNVNPYQSPMYRQSMQGADRGLATGISALQDRRSALAGVGGLVQRYNDASLKAAATAEGQQSQALGQLGQATGMKAQEEKYPFELKANLLAMKAGGGTNIANAGIKNLGDAASTYAQMQMLNKLYGGGGGGKTG